MSAVDSRNDWLLTTPIVFILVIIFFVVVAPPDPFAQKLALGFRRPPGSMRPK